MAKKALGKGLGALISNVSQRRQDSSDDAGGEGVDSPRSEEEGAGSPKLVPIEEVVASPLQPRQEFAPGQIEELKVSILEHGIIQPLVVRRVRGGLELIAGERRLRAAKEAGLEEVPVLLAEASDRKVLEMALIENLQREDLNPIEEAEAYQRLSKDFNLTQEEIAKSVGKNRATVANTMRLLDLSPAVRKMVAQGSISTGHAKVILGLKHHSVQKSIAERIVSEGLTVRQAETEVEKELAAGTSTSSGKRRKKPIARTTTAAVDAAVDHVEERLRTHFATQVSLKHGEKKGRIEIEYYGNDDLERILDLMGVDPDFG